MMVRSYLIRVWFSVLLWIIVNQAVYRGGKRGSLIQWKLWATFWR